MPHAGQKCPKRLKKGFFLDKKGVGNKRKKKQKNLVDSGR